MTASAAEGAQRWFLVLSPDGAARSVSLRCAKEFADRFDSSCKTFDSLGYRTAFKQMQKAPDEEITVDLLNQSLAVSCIDFEATHLLVCALSPVTVFTLNLLRKQGMKTIHWFYEDFRRAEYWKDVITGYDHFCAIQRGPLPRACEAAGAKFHFLPTAASDTGFAGKGAVRPHDVCFIGIPSPYRTVMLETLFRNGIKLAIGGSGWNSYRGILQQSIIKTQWISEDESLGILSRSKIGLNLSLDEPRERELVHISPRVYDVMMAGCVLVSEHVPLLEESIKGCVFQTFNSPDELTLLIRKILQEYRDFETVIEKNKRLVITEHSYTRRVDQIIELAS